VLFPSRPHPHIHGDVSLEGKNNTSKSIKSGGEREQTKNGGERTEKSLFLCIFRSFPAAFLLIMYGEETKKGALNRRKEFGELSKWIIEIWSVILHRGALKLLATHGILW
jgi:hypothetical protein